ncbi:MAG: hypothetical protein WC807_06625 [Hyphomicrobium sp.]|jgi:branched-subunit amino acid transport protein
MSDRTQFAIARNRTIAMPRVMKRSLQVIVAALLTTLVVLIVMMANGFLAGRGGSLAGVDQWLAFIRRSDIVATIVLTALVTVSFLYWQKDRERR